MTPDAGMIDPEKPKLLEPAPGVFVRQEIDNMGWTDTGEGVLVVDALEQPETGKEVLSLLRDTETGRPVRWVINTHTHYDHVALNPMFVREFGAEIINARTREIPEAGLRLGGPDRTVHVIPVPGCHTAEDCVVWLPDDGVLFVGDIFGWGLIPWDGPLNAEKLQYILQTYRRLIDFRPDHVVPGHGPLFTVRELERWISYIEETVATVAALIKRGVSPKEIDMELVPPPEDMRGWWRFVQWKHQDTLHKITHAFRRDRL